MQIIQGNLWNYHQQGPVCITTNGIIRKNGDLVMGAGIALQAKQRFPALPAKLGLLVSQDGNHVFYSAEERILSFPTKNDWRLPSDINLIARSAREAVRWANNAGFHSVFLPVPGCANGQLKWNQVYYTISPILDDRFVVVLQ